MRVLHGIFEVVIWKSAVYLVISIVSVLITVEFKGEVCCGIVLVPNSSMLVRGVFD